MTKIAEAVDDEAIVAPTKEQILAHIKEAEELLRQNHPRAAMMLGWATIEAAARTMSYEVQFKEPFAAQQAINLLEHLGCLRFEDAQDLRSLLSLRNKVLHGDFQTAVSADEVERVLKAARAALEAA